MTITKESLKSYHTKQLLNALRKCCIDQRQLDDSALYNFDNDGEYIKECGLSWNDFDKHEIYQRSIVPPEALGHLSSEGWASVVTIAELKQELSLREHVMNKLEAKELRREKAKAKKNR